MAMVIRVISGLPQEEIKVLAILYSSLEALVEENLLLVSASPWGCPLSLADGLLSSSGHLTLLCSPTSLSTHTFLPPISFIRVL